jgi:non-ribosomal peptide synthetase component E (peptide arylation enzyme)
MLVGDPRISQIAIVDVPDERLGERLCACVVPARESPALTLTDITNIARQRGLAKYKWPEYLQIIEELPLSPAGKIKRPALREMILRRIEGVNTGHG